MTADRTLARQLAARSLGRGQPLEWFEALYQQAIVKAECFVEKPRVWTFFYGSYINLAVLEEVDLVTDRYEVARLGGFDIRIQPLANLVRSDRHCVYGIVATATHDELARLYRHAADVLGGVYLPEAVLTETTDGNLRPALCYIAPSMEPQPATNDYVDRIVGPARQYGFPAWYIERLESFRPTSPASSQR